MNTIETTLASILVADRHRPKLAGAGESMPLLANITLEEEADPCLSSNAKGSFVTTRTRNKEIRYGFSEISSVEESVLSNSLHQTLMRYSSQWGNWAKTPLEGVELLKSLGSTPAAIVVSTSYFADPNSKNWEIEKVSTLQPIAEQGVRVLVTDLPKEAALVVARPKDLGIYTRVGDHVGLLFKNVNRTMVVVAP